MMKDVEPGATCVRLFRVRPDCSSLFGRQFLDGADGTVWRLVAQNDLNVPYWVKVTGGKPGKTQYTLSDGESIVARWLAT